MHACYACGSGDSRVLPRVLDEVTGEFFDISFCKDCGHGETLEAPADLSPYYQDYHGGRHRFLAGFRARRRVNMARKASTVSPGSNVDIGCGEARFIAEMRRRGWVSVGTERSRKGNGVFATLEEVAARFGETCFDLITAWHSLEHFADPVKELRLAGELLSEDGRIVVAVPSCSSLQSRMFGKNWLHLDPPRHIHHFSERSLRQTLMRSGFEVVSERGGEGEYDLLGWSQSALNAITQEKNLFFRIVIGKARPGAIIGTLNLAAGALASILFMPAVLLGSVLGKGGTLVVVAKKSGEGQDA